MQDAKTNLAKQGIKKDLHRPKAAASR